LLFSNQVDAVSKYYCVLWKGKPVEVHEIEIFRSDRDRYHQLSSLQAFIARESLKCFDESSDVRCDVMTEKEWFEHLNFEAAAEDVLDLTPSLSGLPRQAHLSVWSIYLAIGYDYKTGKYVES
jgi:hypothetical protein